MFTGDTDVVSDPKSQDFNADKRVQDFINMANDRASHYRHNEVLVLMGCDFQYIDSGRHYQNMDNIISYINTHMGDKYHAQYSTPSDYVKAVHSYDLKWPTKYDDMMPYADDPHQFWTGYFTARPNNKAYIRELSH